MTEAPSSLIDPGRRLWIIGVDVLDGSREIDKVLGEITE
jgi:hypothetical protein